VIEKNKKIHILHQTNHVNMKTFSNLDKTILVEVRGSKFVSLCKILFFCCNKQTIQRYLGSDLRIMQHVNPGYLQIIVGSSQRWKKILLCRLFETNAQY
jgi:hypothetical protein